MMTSKKKIESRSYNVVSSIKVSLMFKLIFYFKDSIKNEIVVNIDNNYIFFTIIIVIV